MAESTEVGKPVGKIAAHDADLGANAEIKYSILNTEVATVFSIGTSRDGREGVISLRKVCVWGVVHVTVCASKQLCVCVWWWGGLNGACNLKLACLTQSAPNSSV